MDPVAAKPVIPATTTTTTTTTTPTPVPVSTPDGVGGGVQGVIGDLIRSTVAGYQQATKQAGVQADKAAIIPFETVSTATGLLKEKTQNVKGVGSATGLLHTIGGFALLILTANVASTLKSPGETAVDIGNRVADLIDGKSTAEGWNLGWGVRSEVDLGATSSVGTALGNAGML